MSDDEEYQQIDHLRHITLRPDTYISNPQPSVQQCLLPRRGVATQTYSSGLYKAVDEIFNNAIDNTVRKGGTGRKEISVTITDNEITVKNSGAGQSIDLENRHRATGLYYPTLLFGHLLTSGNYNDNIKRTVGGRNGYGAKLMNAFSSFFEVVVTQDGKLFRQSWTDGMKEEGEVFIGKGPKKESVCVRFCPNWALFGMKSLADTDAKQVLEERVRAIPACTGKNVDVYLNGDKLEQKDFRSYVQSQLGEDTSVEFYFTHDRWQVAVALSPFPQFAHTSFVNGIVTSKGGTHVNHVVDQVTRAVVDKVGKSCKPSWVKDNIWVFINAVLENPTFTSQTKTECILSTKDFGSRFDLPAKAGAKLLKLSKVSDSGACLCLSELLGARQSTSDALELKKNTGNSQRKLHTVVVPKLQDANWAGTRDSHKCSLILTEGDSAANFAARGVSALKDGRNRFGVFPLRGKFVNSRGETLAKVKNNEEACNLMKSLNMVVGVPFQDLKKRYGHVVILVDADLDGNHIKGLLIDFFGVHWPESLHGDFIQFIVTPIIKAIPKSRRGQSLSFYSKGEYERWTQLQEASRYDIKYYKGLGTSVGEEAKGLFENLVSHLKTYTWDSKQSPELLNLCFDPKNANKRKEWITSVPPGTSTDLEYNKEQFTFCDLVNVELRDFSVYNVKRSIPHVIDGLKVSKRKVLFGCFQKHLYSKEMKVARLAALVGEKTAYHHGEQSLQDVIVGMAQDFLGSNQLNLLLPNGEFGSRAKNGKDAAAPRYIFTVLTPLIKHLLPPDDFPVLDYNTDEGEQVEPVTYAPLLPLLLVNGVEGIGTGFSTSVPQFNAEKIITRIICRLRGVECMRPLQPSYVGFKGKLQPDAADDGKYVMRGCFRRTGETQLTITETPVGVALTPYIEETLKKSAQPSVAVGKKRARGSEQPEYTLSYGPDNTPDSIDVTLTFSDPDTLRQMSDDDIVRRFDLSKKISTRNMHAFTSGETDCVKRYTTAEEIIDEHFEFRLSIYDKRKQYDLDDMTERIKKQSALVKYLEAYVTKKFLLGDISESELVSRINAVVPEAAEYLDGFLALPTRTLTREKITSAEAKLKATQAQFDALSAISNKDMYANELRALVYAVDDLKLTAPRVFGNVVHISSERVKKALDALTEESRVFFNKYKKTNN